MHCLFNECTAKNVFSQVLCCINLNVLYVAYSICCNSIVVLVSAMTQCSVTLHDK